MKKALLTLICGLCLLMAVPACAQADEAADAVKNLLSYYEFGQKGDIEGMKTYMSKDYRAEFENAMVANKAFVEMAFMVSAKAKYTIKDAVHKDGIVTINVHVDQPDFEKIIQKIAPTIDPGVGEAEFYRLLTTKMKKLIDDGDYDTSAEETAITMVKEDGQWKIFH